ncbi:hypothetical protein CCY99_07270 [Helicobacter sp. 16-1353]|uniref:hypothetical protein n=1 Tax=Helicobacter sp. 16-1353 TaxID=2004996 RepID=UPI000DCE1AD2|nr:hypothetical protein [Helicobacter sp. 16-1353]RAX52442.1 hypothetical protein CCY99_07270 [Helicobacter sp. 16-1353]
MARILANLTGGGIIIENTFISDEIKNYEVALGEGSGKLVESRADFKSGVESSGESISLDSLDNTIKKA